MISILLCVLKILAILVLVTLGLIIFLVMLILLVPIRYRISGKYQKSPDAKAEASWLLHLIHIAAEYHDDLLIRVKVLGFQIFTTEEDADEVESELEEVIESGTDQARAVSEVIFETDQYSQPDVRKGYTEEPKADPAECHTEETDTELDECQPEDAEKKPDECQPEDAGKKPDECQPEESKSEPEEDLSEKSEPEPEEKISFLQRLKARLRKIRKKELRARRSFDKKLNAAKKKKEQIAGFLSDPQNQTTIKIVLAQVIKLLKHVLPKRMDGFIRFGFDDPYITGTILTWISPFYGFYANSLQIVPVFDEKVLEAELRMNGRIRLGSVAVIVIRVILDKNFRRLFREFRKHRY